MIAFLSEKDLWPVRIESTGGRKVIYCTKKQTGMQSLIGADRIPVCFTHVRKFCYLRLFFI